MEGTLEVVVYRGRNLVALKKDEKPTTSVEIKLGKELVGTKTVENNSNPQWNTVHKFEGVDIKNSKLALELTLKDKKDKFLGRIKIPIAESLTSDDAPNKQYRLEQWFPLLDKKLSPDVSISGEIQVKLRFISAREIRQKAESKAKAQDEAIQEQVSARDKLLEGKKPRPIQNGLSEHHPAGPVDDIVDEQTQQVFKEIERVRTESRDSTIRSMQKIHEAQEVGTASLEKLDRQGEQLRRVVGDSEQIEGDMKISARQIRGIKSIFGAMANKFSRSPSGGRKSRSGARDVEKSESKEAQTTSVAQAFGTQQMTEEQLKKYEEDAVDRDLETISNGINNLRHLAVDMGKEINSQSVTIDRLIDQTEKNDGLLRKYNAKIARH